MKTKNYFLLAMLGILISFSSFGQDVWGSDVPAVIRTNFQNSFPEAKDIDWEKEGDLYQVEFEIGFWNDDHEAWYNEAGEMVRHKQEISKKELPRPVRLAIGRNYKYHWIKDVMKDTHGSESTYKVELWSLTNEWDVVYDSTGKELSKVRD